MDNTTFIFNGVKSSDMDLYIIRMSDGMYGTPFVGAREIVEVERPYSNIPELQRVRKRPIEFTLELSTLDKQVTPEMKFDIAKWLIKDEYKEFQTTDYLGKVFNVIAISEVQFHSMGNRQGYFEITFRCDAPWAWSPLIEQTYDLSTNTSIKTIEMYGNFNVGEYYYPELEFKLIGTSTGLSIKNLNDKSRVFEFTGLDLNETIYINNDKRRILSSKNGVFRLGNFNKNWFRLRQGRNVLEITGKCLLKTRMRYPIYT